MVKLALDRGINFIDTADVYSLGESETLVGNTLQGVRDEIVLATKVRLPMSENFKPSGATRVNIMREVEGSLRRLQTDYIDLTRYMDGIATRRSRKPCGRSTILCAMGRSAISGCPLHVMAGDTAVMVQERFRVGEIRNGADVLQPRRSGSRIRVPVIRRVPQHRHPGLEPACRRVPHRQVQPRQPCSSRHPIRGRRFVRGPSTRRWATASWRR